MALERDFLIDQLSKEIDQDVGRVQSDDIDRISNLFDKSIQDAVRTFHSTAYDADGFISSLSNMNLSSNEKDVIKNVLNSVRNDYIGLDMTNQTELMLRRDIYNICTQMPEMHDVIQIVRDSIIECNVATGKVSRTISFDTQDENRKITLEAEVNDIEEQNNLLMAIKNFIVPKTLMNGEMYINVVPYKKLFAELDALSQNDNYKIGYSKNPQTSSKAFHESVPEEVSNYFKESFNLDNDNNLAALFESVSYRSKVDSKDTHTIENGNAKVSFEEDIKTDLHALLSNIEIHNGSSVMFSEMGPEGFREFLRNEVSPKGKSKKKKTLFQRFNESNGNWNSNVGGLFNDLDQDAINTKAYDDIKGCYIKYLDGLRIIPNRMDRRVAGYFYATTTLDLHSNPAMSNGIVDLSYQTYTKDKKLVSQLAEIIIKSFDREFLDKNIKLKAEIAEIIEAHKFSEGRLSFIYIPEDEVVRLVINEDEEGKGHSIIEPCLFPARLYLMLTLYNTLYILNNNTTRVHYLKSSGLNKDYASQIQRTMRKFQDRRVSIDDIYSYTGVMNKLGGMGEMVLPAGRSDFKALETDTIPAVENPISMEFLENLRRQAISGSGVPNLLVINAIDEVDFAKTLELANARYLATIGSYKIDFNDGLTQFYKIILRNSTSMEDDEVDSFRFQFNEVKQQELVITAEMINNFNSTIELEESVFFSKNELFGEDGNPTQIEMEYRKARAKKLLPQLDIDELSKVVDEIRQEANKKKAEKIGDKAQNIDANDLEELNS